MNNEIIQFNEIYSPINEKSDFPGSFAEYDTVFILFFSQGLNTIFQSPGKFGKIFADYFQKLQIPENERTEKYLYFSFHTFPYLFYFFIYKEIVSLAKDFLISFIENSAIPELCVYLVSSIMLSATDFITTFCRTLSLKLVPKGKKLDFSNYLLFIKEIMSDSAYLLPKDYIIVMLSLFHKYPDSFQNWFVSYLIDFIELQMRYTYKFPYKKCYNDLINFLHELNDTKNQCHIESLLLSMFSKSCENPFSLSLDYLFKSGSLKINLSGKDIFTLNEVFLSANLCNIDEIITENDGLFKFDVILKKEENEKCSNLLEDLFGEMPNTFSIPKNQTQERIWETVSAMSDVCSYEERFARLPKDADIVYIKNKQVEQFLNNLQHLNDGMIFTKNEDMQKRMMRNCSEINSLLFSDIIRKNPDFMSYQVDIKFDSTQNLCPSLPLRRGLNNMIWPKCEKETQCYSQSFDLVDGFSSFLQQKGYDKSHMYDFDLWISFFDSLAVSFDRSLLALEKMFFEIVNKKLQQLTSNHFDHDMRIRTVKLMEYCPFLQNFQGNGYGKRLMFIIDFIRNAKIVFGEEHWEKSFLYIIAQTKDFSENELLETYLFLDSFVFSNKELYDSFESDVINHWTSFSFQMLMIMESNQQLSNLCISSEIVRTQFVISKN